MRTSRLMQVTFWHDYSKGWRSRFIRGWSKGPVGHVTCTIDGRTLHSDLKYGGWYSTYPLFHSYGKTYAPIQRFHLKCTGKYIEPRTCDSTWATAKWYWLWGKAPVTCSTLVTRSLNANGHNFIEHPDPNILLEQFNDCSWTKWQGENWQVPPDK